jgi:transaldolase
MRIEDLNVKIFADGADRAGMLEMYKLPYIHGFTTNPTLMRKAGVTDYRAFAIEMVKAIPDRSISFEVFSDDFHDMARQAMEIASWGKHVYVKIPITNTKGESAVPLIQKLSRAGVKINVTAVMTLDQVFGLLGKLDSESYVSVFAGRIADTGRDPVCIMREALDILGGMPNVELIWASPRQVLDIFTAEWIGCHIITVTNDILKKLDKAEYDLDAYSLDTVKMFYDDAQKAGYTL